MELEWTAVRERPAEALAVGDSWINPGAGTAYSVRADGTVRGVGIAWAPPLRGTVWTLTARDGNRIEARNHLGAEQSGIVRPGQTVLVVG